MSFTLLYWRMKKYWGTSNKNVVKIYPQNWNVFQKTLRVGYVYIEKSVDTILNICCGGGGVQRPCPCIMGRKIRRPCIRGLSKYIQEKKIKYMAVL